MMKEAWKSHEIGIDHYYQKDFRKAMTYFQIACKLLPDDYCSEMFFTQIRKIY